MPILMFTLPEESLTKLFLLTPWSGEGDGEEQELTNVFSKGTGHKCTS